MDGGNPNEVYRECLRNHAASLGSYATDGCGEFTLDVDVDVDVSDGSQLQCAACGCHRNFHRKVVSYIGNGRGLSSSSSRGREEVEYGNGNKRYEESEVDVERERREKNMKRFRSKFTGEQKEKMFGFAEKLGWKLQRKDVDEQVQSFCQGIGVTRQVFKVWMHNHKNNSSSSSSSYPNPIPPPPSLTHH